MQKSNKIGLSNERKKGFALLFVMVFAAIITVFTASVGAQASFNLRLAGDRGEIDRAYYTSQTGTQLILSLLREPPPVDDYDGDGVDSSWLGEDASVALDIESTNAQAKARVYHNIQGFPNATDTAPDGTTIPVDHFYIISIGIVNGVYDAGGDLQSGASYEANTMGATLNPSYPIMPHALFGYDSINVDGRVAHFDSRDDPAATGGVWMVAGLQGAPGLPGPPGFPADNMQCSFPEASVGVAATDEASVDIGENARIDGHIIFGEGTAKSERDDEALAIAALAGGAAPDVPPTNGLPALVYGEAATAPVLPVSPHVNGVVDALLSERPIPNMIPDPADVATTYPASPSSVNLVLEEGLTYLKQGDLQVVFPNTITVNDTNGDGEVDDTILIVDGNISFQGVTIGTNGVTHPRTLKIYSLNGNSFNMNGSTAFCLVGGEELNVQITGNSTLWGAVLGKDVTLDSSSAIIYDVTLRDPTLIADIYGYYLVGANISAGAKIATGVMGPTGTPAAAPPAAPPAAPAAPPPAPAPTTGCGCGGCGCGSMLVVNKL